MVTEVPRAIRGRAAADPDVDLAEALGRAEVVLSRVALHPVSRIALWRAGRLFEPGLRSFDAVHLITALELRPIDAFVTYDQRQAKAAHRAGLPTYSPGMEN
jgi:uncharacterized protein